MADQAYDVVFAPNTKQRHPIKMWTKHVDVEESALEQLKNISQLPFIHSHVAVMPDVHWGMGATIGSVIPTIKAIVPAAVGVDIGCGMMARRTSLKASDLPDNLGALRNAIERAVPHGRTNNGARGDRGAWHDLKLVNQNAGTKLYQEISDLFVKYPKLRDRGNYSPLMHHLGTLGGGNHFIELCLDQDNFVWIMLHSGSRGIGNRIGTFFINQAKELMDKYFIELPDKNLSYLPEGTDLMVDYLLAVDWAQRYAQTNRHLMMDAVTTALSESPELPQFTYATEAGDAAIECHHNYVKVERHYGKNVYLTRKGAVCAALDVYGIIPGSMGAKSYIVRGLGNRDSFNSCSHGAGRVMSRTQAKRELTIDDHTRDTAGVECRKDETVLDESPKAYKNIDDVMKSQSDLVEIKHTLKQVLCVKG